MQLRRKGRSELKLADQWEPSGKIQGMGCQHGHQKKKSIKGGFLTEGLCPAPLFAKRMYLEPPGSVGTARPRGGE